MADRGGGLCVSTNGHPVVSDCVFRYNHTPGDGGGISYEFRPDSTRMTVSRCLFRSNTAWCHGGGIAIEGRNSFVDCVFTANQAPFGAGFFDCAGTSGAEFLRCTFVRNVTTTSGTGEGGAT